MILALAILSSGLSLAQQLSHSHQQARARRGDLQVKVKAAGSVVASEVFRLKSAVEGRVESVTVSTYTWASPDIPLGILANKQLSAVIDAHGRSGNDILEDNWQRLYKPTKILCPQTCFILKNYIKARQPVKAHAVLIEAAKNLRLIGHIKIADAHWVRFGQTLEYWAVKNPARKLKTRIANYKIDAKGAEGEPGGRFTLNMSPESYLDPGLEWEGLILPTVKKNVLMVPTAALILHEDSLYLPVRISTGVTTDEATEITAGVEENRPVLVLDASSLGEATRHQFAPDPEALRRRPFEEQPKKKAEKSAPRDPQLGPDPYEE